MRLAVGLGANLAQREENIQNALKLLAQHIGALERESSLFETEPMVLPGQDASTMSKFLNAVALFQTELAPLEILSCIRDIERTLGRKRELETGRWQPRSIDIDILALDEILFNEPGLQIPHAEMHRRSFVLLPFQEVWPEWRHPKLKKSVGELLTELSTEQNALA